MSDKTFSVIIDTREKTPWEFKLEEKKPGKFQLLGAEISGLSTGDYTIRGMEDLVAIERKNSFTELYSAFINRDYKERFEREMERISSYKYKYLIIESSPTHELISLNPPQMRNGGPQIKHVIAWVYELQIKYGIVPVFAGECGQTVARIIFEQILKVENGRSKTNN